MKELTLLLILFIFVLAGANGQAVKDTTLLDTAQSFSPKENKPFFVTACKKDLNMVIVDTFRTLNEIKNTKNVFCTPHRVDATVYYLDDVLLTKLEFNESLQTPMLEVNHNMITFKREKLLHLALRDINEIVNLTAGVQLTGNGLSFKGSREDGTAYYLDGMRILDNSFANNL